MSEHFEKVKDYILDLDLSITHEDEAEELVVVEDEENGIKGLVVDCEDPILVLEQLILKVPAEPGDLYETLLKLNRSLVHGAFVLDEEANNVIWRDTLQLENLDHNELEGSISALSLGLAENAETLLKHAAQD